MEKTAIIDIIKKIVIFICILISGFLLLILISAIYGPYTPYMEVLLTFPGLILTLFLIAVSAKYIGDIVIVALTPDRE